MRRTRCGLIGDATSISSAGTQPDSWDMSHLLPAPGASPLAAFWEPQEAPRPDWERSWTEAVGHCLQACPAPSRRRIVSVWQPPRDQEHVLRREMTGRSSASWQCRNIFRLAREALHSQSSAVALLHPWGQARGGTPPKSCQPPSHLSTSLAWTATRWHSWLRCTQIDSCDGMQRPRPAPPATHAYMPQGRQLCGSRPAASASF